MAGVVAGVLGLEVREDDLAGLQYLDVAAGVGAHLLEVGLVPLAAGRLADGAAAERYRAPPGPDHLAAEGGDARRYPVRRHLGRHLRVLALADPRARRHPELVLHVLLQARRLEVRVTGRQRALTVVQLLAAVHHPERPPEQW